MRIGNQGSALQDLTMLFNVGTIGGFTDAQLLERFISARDEIAERAFRVLVERHGPMVLRVCLGVLCDEHDAHDAFQATFLVLVSPGQLSLGAGFIGALASSGGLSHGDTCPVGRGPAQATRAACGRNEGSAG